MQNQQPVSVAFTEEMKGYVDLGSSNPTDRRADTSDRQKCMFHLTIAIPDIDFFLVDPRAQGTAKGYIDSEAIGGRTPIDTGVFRCFVDAGEPHKNTKHMYYQLPFNDADGKPRTLSGHKVVKRDGIARIWRDTSTLYFQLLDGHVDIDEPKSLPIGAGVLRIHKRDFLKQLFTFRTTGPSRWRRLLGLLKFQFYFAVTLWSVYIARRRSAPDPTRKREIPLFTLEGVKTASITTRYVKTDDNYTLSMLRFQRGAPSKDVVLLLHGLSTSTDMFIMPEHDNLVSYLLDNKYTDVWSFDWRGSMRYAVNTFPNTFNMDDVALYDHPAAIKAIRDAVGPGARIHVICHCVGSITFIMSLFAGLVKVDSVISNSVSLTPQVAPWGWIKAAFAPALVAYVLRFPHLNPNWAVLPGPGIPQGKLVAKFVSLFHRECDVSACHMLSFMWGVGHPAIYVHENMLDVTHQRVGDLFGAVALSFDRHLKKCVYQGKVVKFSMESRYDALPNTYLEGTAKVDTPILFVSGTVNNVFGRSNAVTFEVLNRLKPSNPFAYRDIEGYGHQDVFMGKTSAKDCFPIFLEHLNRHSVDIVVEAPVESKSSG